MPRIPEPSSSTAGLGGARSGGEWTWAVEFRWAHAVSTASLSLARAAWLESRSAPKSFAFDFLTAEEGYLAVVGHDGAFAAGGPFPLSMLTRNSYPEAHVIPSLSTSHGTCRAHLGPVDIGARSNWLSTRTSFPLENRSARVCLTVNAQVGRIHRCQYRGPRLPPLTPNTLVDCAPSGIPWLTLLL